jgi:hypothetical protein
MAEYTEEQVREAVDRIKVALADGFQFGDIAFLVKEVMGFAKDFTGLTGAEKKALAMNLAETVLAETDVPWLPDQLNLPIIGEVGADALILKGVDKLIDMAWDAAKGRLGLVAPEAEDAPSE